MLKGKLYTPAAPKDGQLELIRSSFAQRLGGEVQLEVIVDPSLIGGVRVEIDGRVYDGSIQNRLTIKQDIQPEAEDDVPDTLEARLERMHGFKNRAEVLPVGYVISVGDGIAHVNGLNGCRNNELLRFEGGRFGIAFNLERDSVGVIMLDKTSGIQEGSRVEGTGRIVSVPVGERLLGRVVDPLGRAIDGKEPIRAKSFRPIETEAPPIIERGAVKQPLQTGYMAIDSMVPIGRGQRELIIGDRQTGKTAIAVDTIINQKHTGVVCIYVAIGQKASTIASVKKTLEDNGAMEYTTIVAATASDSAPMQYIAPYAGCAMAEEFMYAGRDALIVYDDLSKHAVAYRAISLLLRRPPGREAYPGDVFYLHSRLLERAACLNDENGGGSMTALPIVETQAGDISAYIPTNVISITDGQIFLEEGLFNAGVRPAINAGLSVSRVGGAAQPKAMKQFASRLRMDLAQHRELESFAQFGSDLDKATRDALNRGRKLTELLKQKRYDPRTVAEQVVAIFAANEGYMDDLDTEKVPEFEQGLTAYAYAQAPDLCQVIEGGAKLDKDQIQRLRQVIEEFKKNF